MNHAEWIQKLQISYQNEQLPEDLGGVSRVQICPDTEIDLDRIELIYRSSSKSFRDIWLQYWPPLIERQNAMRKSVSVQ